MADDTKKGQQFEGSRPEEKKISSGDRSGQGRERRDDHVFPEGAGRNEFGTHGGPGQKRAPANDE